MILRCFILFISDSPLSATFCEFLKGRENMRYCTNCGKQLNDGENCDCKKGVAAKIDFVTTGIQKMTGIDVSDADINIYERDMNIVPDSISANDGEVPIKQYNLAILRSRLRGQRAEGRLQVTNKRLLFRANGTSLLGKTNLQYEFNISEIAGIEVKKAIRVSLLSVFLGIFLCLAVYPFFSGITEAVYDKSEFLSAVIAVVCSVGSILFSFLVKKKGWLKLFLLSGSLGALLGSSGLSLSVLDIVFEFKLFTITNIFIFLTAIVWFINLLLISFVPDLTFYIKTKSASNVFEIKRRVWGVLNLSKNEYTGFSEVLPWKDTDLAAQELGSLIDDLQTMGDLAIEKWRNN